MDGPQLRIRLEPSRRLLALLGLLHLGAIAAPWVSALPWAAALGLSAAALLSLVATWRAHRRARAHGGWELECRDGAWTLQAGGVAEAVTPLPDSTVLPALIVLRLRAAAGVRTLVLLADSAPAAELRRLRVALRFGPLADPP